MTDKLDSHPKSLKWSVSIVSHGHKESIERQLNDLSKHSIAQCAELLVTLNHPDETQICLDAWAGEKRIIRSERPKGFAENHNQALSQAKGKFFAVIDPDLEWIGDPFPALEQALSDPAVGISAPCITNEDGSLADSARPFPTMRRVFLRRLFGRDDGYPYPQKNQSVDWLAGLFLSMRSETWRALGGFDKRYRLYVEDVDLSFRCRKMGREVVRIPVLAAKHPARRQSKRSFRYGYWHLSGLLRFWFGLIRNSMQSVQ